ncbi:hypothetical protein OE88DRAFT_930885 [Heliocybe sulcata]|uniref:Protein kinase domain-containing protein n=1 Tax=Heliocybe sulcata TaxID=5364 RepID=A0A5C3MNJ9_9AGAM|nr:hypothetical protein OE88DRAFT_930885 [Heliocybe sulcata]
MGSTVDTSLMARSSRDSINSCTLSESLSALGQHQSSEAHHEVHRRWAGDEGAREVYGGIQPDIFFSLAAPDIKEHLLRIECPKGFRKDLKYVPTGTSVPETDMYGSLIRSFNAASADGTLHLRIKDCSATRPDAYPGGPKLSPDLMVIKEGESSDHWGTSRAFIEVKRSDDADPYPNANCKLTLENMEIWNQIQEYAAVALNLKPRCFLFAASIFGSNARLFRWDRSVVLVSSAFNYKKQPKPLYQFLHCVSQYADGGYDPSVLKRSGSLRLFWDRYGEAKKAGLIPEFQSVIPGNYPEDESVLLQVPGRTSKDPTEVYLTMGPPLFVSRSLVGRGTRVWLATLADGSSPDFVIIKDTWRDANRVAEGEIYQSIEGIPGVARLGRAVDLGRGDQSDVHTTIAKAVNEHYGAPRFVQRIHYRSIILSIGRPLDLFRSTRELTEAMRSALGGLSHMAESKIIHRDISVNNIMISTDPAAKKDAKGFVIDPELAAVPGKTDDRSYITGTFQFLAIERLMGQPGDHEQYHDLESVYWVLLWVVLRHTKSQVIEWGRTKCGTDCVAAIFDEGGAHKVAFLCTAEVVVPGNKPLTALLDRLQFLVSLRYMNKRLRSHAEKVPLPKMTYEEVMEAFDDALKSEGWPSDDPAIPFKLKTKGVKAERVEIITTQSHHATRAAPSAAERPSSGGSSPLASVITTMESLTLVSPESSSAGKPQPYTTTSQSAQHGINNAQLRDARVTASSDRPQGRRTGSGAAPERVVPRTRSSQRALPDASGSKSATGAVPFPSSSQTANETGTSRSQGSRPREPRSTSSSWSRLPTSSSGVPSAPGAVGSSSPRIAEKEEERDSGPPDPTRKSQRLVRRDAS